jgi:methylaspartate ammonia-lyase
MRAYIASRNWSAGKLHEQLLGGLLRRLVGVGHCHAVAVGGAGDRDDLDHVRLALVQLDLVDRRLETVVVAAQRLQHLPDDLEALVVRSVSSGSMPLGTTTGSTM